MKHKLSRYYIFTHNKYSSSKLIERTRFRIKEWYNGTWYTSRISEYMVKKYGIEITEVEFNKYLLVQRLGR
jgi:hypothetical protein